MNPYDDDACPEYDVAVSRSSNSNSRSGSIRWQSPFDDAPPPPLNVEPLNGRPEPGDYNFYLSLKVNQIERQICDATKFRLTVDPRTLDFVVFVFPGKSSLPVGSLWSLRVWIRNAGVSHRLFSDDELFIGKDLDFNSIADASFARLKTVSANNQVYQAFVGKAPVTFTVAWKQLSDNLFTYTFSYEAGGIGAILFEDLKMKVDCDPKRLTFTIYSVPMTSTPAGASHRIRIWVRSMSPFPSDPNPVGHYTLPFTDSYTYHRLWKTDGFRLGAHLDFLSLSNKMVLGFAAGGPQTIVTTRPLPPQPSSRKQAEQRAIRHDTT
ncbi:hypothetical protein ONZ45_g15051 [Pleurotus djamor]|nr:hypothetical protein ONZ45_g15051 [Pleurotus djamor]